MKKETAYNVVLFLAFVVLATLGTMTAYNDEFYQEVGSYNRAKVEVLNDSMLLLVERTSWLDVTESATVIKGKSMSPELFMSVGGTGFIMTDKLIFAFPDGDVSVYTK